MARLEVHEGTWEELSAHAEEFKGRKLRLIVLSEESEASGSRPDNASLHERAKQLFSETDSIEREPGRVSNDPHKIAFDEIVTQKHKKMGLKL